MSIDKAIDIIRRALPQDNNQAFDALDTLINALPDKVTEWWECACGNCNFGNDGSTCAQCGKVKQ